MMNQVRIEKSATGTKFSLYLDKYQNQDEVNPDLPRAPPKSIQN